MKSPEHGTGGGPAGIDPPPGEGTAEAPGMGKPGDWGTTSSPLIICMSPSGRYGFILTLLHHYTFPFSHVANCSPSELLTHIKPATAADAHQQCIAYWRKQVILISLSSPQLLLCHTQLKENGVFPNPRAVKNNPAEAIVHPEWK